MDKLNPRTARLRLGEHGRLVLPAEVRRLLGLRAGDTLLLRFVDGEVRLTPPALGIAHARALVRRHARDQGGLVAGLLAARRRELGRE
jgi:AbrB family looped-hinge helix DNA binding protein